MAQPPVPSRVPAIVAGVLLGLAGLGAPRCARSEFVRETFVERPLAAAAAHEASTAATEFNRRRLELDWSNLGRQIQCAVLAFALAAFAHAAFGPTARARVSLLATVTCGGCLIASGLYAAFQTTTTLGEACQEGWLHESSAERFADVYPDAARAAELVARVVPDDARVLVVHFADADHVHAFGYAAFPRRVYTPQDPHMRFDADTFRALLATRPNVLAECQARGYAAAVDLALLVQGDERGVIPIAPAAEKRP